MDNVITWHGLTFYVVIIILILIDSFRGENVRIFLTKAKHTWFQARNKCSLIGNEHTNITIPTFNSDLMWTGGSARYLPWVEYLGCFGLKEDRELVIKKTNVEKGKQLKECLLHCEQYNFIGLQQSYCVCLHYLMLRSDYIKYPCNTYPAKCQGDQTAFCGSEESRYILAAFSVYKKVNVTERVDDGNCLAVDKNNDPFHYVARNCSVTAFQICLKDSVISESFYQQNESSGTWIDSFHFCQASYMLARYSLVYNNDQFSRGTYWLSNTRRWIQGTFTNPEFCIAARHKEDGSLDRFPIRCETKLSGLCVSREVTPAYVSSANTFATVTLTEASHYPRETNGNKRTSSDDQAPINKVIISVITATGLTLLVAIVIVTLCIRRTSLRSGRHPTLVSQNEVVYVNAPNDLSRNFTADNTIDHMHYQSLNQNRNTNGSNYDILHSAGVDVTSDRQTQSVIGETAEHRQVEVDYQEIQDVSIQENIVLT